MLVADFGTTGGTRTYFFNVIDYLLKNNKKFSCYLPEDQCDTEIEEYFRKNAVAYYLKKGGFKLDVQEGFSRKIQLKNVWKLIQAVVDVQRILKKSATNKIIISTAYNDEYAYFFLLNVKKLLFINHTLAYYKTNHVNNQIFNLCLSHTKKLIGVSQCSIDSMINYYGILQSKKEHCEFLYNYSDFKMDSGKRLTNMTNFTITTIGHIEGYKNPFLWIEIAKQLIVNNPNYNFKFIWAGEGSLMEQCKQKVESFENIYFIGATKKIYELLLETDIYIQPSVMESFGISVIDAMAVGVPVLVNNSTALSEIITDKRNGFLFKNKEEAIEKVEYMIKNYSSLNDLVGIAKREQTDKYTRTVWERGMKNLVEKQ